MNKKKKRIIIISIVSILFVWMFFYYILMDFIFLTRYKHFQNVIEIVKRDYCSDNRVYIIVRGDTIHIYEDTKEDIKGNITELNLELAEELVSIYGWYDNILKVYIECDANGYVVAKFDIVKERMEMSQETRTYSIVYAEDGFDLKYVGAYWMQAGRSDRDKTDYLGKKYWYRWTSDASWG